MGLLRLAVVPMVVVVVVLPSLLFTLVLVVEVENGEKLAKATADVARPPVMRSTLPKFEKVVHIV